MFRSREYAPSLSLLFKASCAVAGLVAAAPSTAQTAAGEGSAAQPEAVETADSSEIIVTARKREESILQVPVVVTAITQEALERYSTDDIYTVAQRVPGLL